MLIIKSINPTGMFSYGRAEDIDVEHKGLVNLLGVDEDAGGSSNGAGKSSLFNALCEILFGENPTGVSGGDVVNQVMDAGFAGRAEFTSWEGIPYRVTYCRGWKEDYYPVDNDNKTKYRGSTATLFLDKLDEGVWRDARGAKMSDTRQLVIDALGTTYTRFVSIAYLSHRVGSRFLRGTNKERMDIMAGITGVEEWDKILVNARSKKLAIEKGVTAAQQKIAYEEGGLGQLQSRLDVVNNVDWVANLNECGDEQTVLHTKLVEVEAALVGAGTKIEQLTQAQAAAYNQTGAGTISQEISDLAVQEAALRNPAFVDESLPAFDQVHVQRVEAKRSEVDNMRGALRMYTSGTDLRSMEECPTCKTPVSPEMKQKIQDSIDHVSTQVESLESELQQLEVARKVEEAKVRDAREARYKERLQGADAFAAQVAEKRALLHASSLEYERLTGELHGANKERGALETEKHTLNTSIEAWSRQMVEARARIQEIETLKESIGEKGTLVATMRAEISGDLENTTVLEWIISNIPYIKLHRMSVAMKQLSEKVNHYLSDMGDTVRVNISSFDEKKNTKGAGDIKDALKSDVRVEVVDGVKNIDPRLYSDGEVAKISNALIRALHDVALQAGHGCNLVLLDEIFSFVDLNNSQRLANSFKGVVTGTTLVTDNSGYVNDLMEFNEVWVARKQDGMTTLEVS